VPLYVHAGYAILVCGMEFVELCDFVLYLELICEKIFMDDDIHGRKLFEVI
jgi:hypothetical protein